MSIRRTVTGHHVDGQAVFVSDDTVEPVREGLLPGVGFYRLWGGEEPPRLPSDGRAPDGLSYFPPIGGFRFGMMTLAPGMGTDALDEESLELAPEVAAT